MLFRTRMLDPGLPWATPWQGVSQTGNLSSPELSPPHDGHILRLSYNTTLTRPGFPGCYKVSNTALMATWGQENPQMHATSCLHTHTPRSERGRVAQGGVGGADPQPLQTATTAQPALLWPWRRPKERQQVAHDSAPLCTRRLQRP